MLSIKHVLARVPFSRSTLLREVERGGFPKARAIAPSRVAWFEDEVEAWQKALDEAAEGKSQRKIDGVARDVMTQV
jgi:prophage regulatory protein